MCPPFPKCEDQVASKRFWILSLVWIAAVAACAPLLIEALDDRGIGLSIPGLSITGSELVVGVVIAFAPPMLVGLWLRTRRAPA